jgi:hypothetical protein
MKIKSTATAFASKLAPTGRVLTIVPTLRVGMHPVTLRVTYPA